ncbi:UNVERIFIED_ORG: type II secretory pathway component GspD/PulD (secretin) [Paraburkholderia sediminicola]|nr:type II secretory pathway component GspD/PulD (secretin) [Paraburkholderia sediminicola]
MKHVLFGVAIAIAAQLTFAAVPPASITLPQPSALPQLPLPPAPQGPRLEATTYRQDSLSDVPKGGFQLYFQQINLGNLVTLAYTDVIKKNFALDASIASRNDLVSVVFQSKRPEDVLPVIQALVEGVGGEVVHKNGIDIYRMKTSEGEDWHIYTYRAKYLAVQDLVQQASGLIKGKFGSQTTINTAPTNDATKTTGTSSISTISNTSTSAQSQQQDTQSALVFQGSAEEHKKLEELLERIDIPQENFDVDAAIYEVQDLKNNETAISGLLKFGGINLNLGTTPVTGGGTLALGPNAFSVTASALRNNSQYKLISQPHLRLRSGEAGNLVITTQTQINTGSVMAQNGTTQQALSYQSAGLNFNITLNGRVDTIAANVNAQYSDFGTASSTGAPDILQRQLETSFNTEDGETIALGGLREAKDTKSQTGLPFLPWNLGKSDSDTSTEFLILLTVHRHQEAKFETSTVE